MTAPTEGAATADPVVGLDVHAGAAGRRWRPDTLRARLTVTVVAAASLLLVIGMGALYAGLTAQLHAAVDQGLRARLQDIAGAARVVDPGAPLADPYAQVLDARGNVVAASATAPDTPVLTSAERSAAARRVVLVDRAATGLPAPARLAARAVPGTDRVAVAGTSLAGLQAANRRLLETLAVALPVLLVLLAAVLRWAIRASLRPVAALSRQAARISTAGAEQRLPQPPGDDEIAELASTLNDMLDRLRVSFERERAFVDDASHELRTPLAVLRGELELALLDNDPVQMRRAVEIAQAEAEHLSNLAVDLLVLARQRAGTLVLQPTAVDLYAVAERTVGRLRPVVEAGVVVTGESVHASVDVRRIEQLLTNLVTNAAQAGAHAVVVRVSRSADSAVLDIDDDGPGFPEDLLPSAFDRFSRGDAARTRRAAGTGHSTGAGLGLPIAAAIVRAHGGQISATNDGSQGGACVHVRLPLRVTVSP
ncbi:MAG: HAMP domain-containing histidine kinase [Actinomycetota bacterium]|nr:HAMP domain-containing histidine kinase [Actinomycetota bacterium]